MSRLGVYFDRAWRGWTILYGVMGVALVGFAVFVLGTQTPKDKEFVRLNLLPLARHVETFRDTQGRLPTGPEFNSWAAKAFANKAVEYYPQKPLFVSGWGTPGRDFIVGAWRGQWMHYYQSWDGKDFAGEMPPLGKSDASHR